MAYQNVGTPRFYINSIEFLTSNGVNPDVLQPYTGDDVFPTDAIFKTIPTPDLPEPSLPYQGYDFSNLPTGVLTGKCFVAILGHKFKTQDRHFRLMEGGGSSETIEPRYQNIVNADTSGDLKPEYDGFSIVGFDYNNDNNSLWVDVSSNATGQSLILGNYFDMPHSPDLNLTMTREYGGIKNIETKSGFTLSNDFGSSNPKWGNLPAWDLAESQDADPAVLANLSKSGRRVWSLSFSYLQGDVFGSNQSIGNNHSGRWYPAYTTDGYESGDVATNTIYGNGFNDNVLTDDSFYSQVIHKTNGGQLPFIFQPDGGGGVVGAGNNNSDQFAICKFDSGFSFQQTAPNLYSVKMKIREVW